jgi:hypothetical protein
VSPPSVVASDPAHRVVKDYVYVSARKVDKFYDQIPKPLLSRLLAKVTLDWPPLKVELAERPVEKNLYVKLAIVLRRIEKEFGVGTIDKPSKFFAGELPLHWGPYGDYYGKPDLIFFGGYTRSTVLGLGGSLEHVMGANPKAKMDSRSDTPWLVDALLRHERGRRLWPNGQDSRFRQLDREMHLQAVEVAVRESEKRRKPAEHMEFVAVRLDKGRVTGEWNRPWEKKEHKTQKWVLLGSPLYVARV